VYYPYYPCYPYTPYTPYPFIVPARGDEVSLAGHGPHRPHVEIKEQLGGEARVAVLAAVPAAACCGVGWVLWGGWGAVGG
jgi:hypothetical protein